jgi:hypothetical protein
MQISREQSSHVIEWHRPRTQSMPSHDRLKKHPVGDGGSHWPGRDILLNTGPRRDPPLLHQTKRRNLEITSKYIIIDTIIGCIDRNHIAISDRASLQRPQQYRHTWRYAAHIKGTLVHATMGDGIETWTLLSGLILFSQRKWHFDHVKVISS